MLDRIRLEDILEVVELDTDEMKSYYNTKTKEMVVISKEDLEYVKSKQDIDKLEDWRKDLAIQALDFTKNREDYISFPTLIDYKEEEIVVKFINSIKDNTDVYNKLKLAIKDEINIKKFKDELYNIDYVDEWYNFREEEFKVVARKWCEDNDIKFN